MPFSQCILHRSEPGGPLEVFIHKATLMGHISSTSLAGLCFVEIGRLFDKLVEEARGGSLDHDQVYPPLAAAMQPGAILDPQSVPKYFPLEKLIKDSMYAYNVIICEDERAIVVVKAAATILALNAYFSRVHQILSNIVPEMMLVVKIVQELGGYADIHPDIKLLIDEQNSVKKSNLVSQPRSHVDQDDTYHPSSEQHESKDDLPSNSAGDGDDADSNRIKQPSPPCKLTLNTTTFL